MNSLTYVARVPSCSALYPKPLAGVDYEELPFHASGDVTWLITCFSCFVTVVELLITHGADVNQTCESIEPGHQPSQKFTPMSFAIKLGKSNFK